jgi:hypothetical protein
MTALSDMPDDLLPDEVRRREVALQEACAEVMRRNKQNGQPVWDEHYVAGILARKRNDLHYNPGVGEAKPIDLPPALFRMGYEWAVLTLYGLMDRYALEPSEDRCLSQEYTPVGKGLFRPKGKPVVTDPRRRAAYDFLETISSFFRHRETWFFVMPKRRSTFRPGDDVQSPDDIKLQHERDQAVKFGGEART